MGGLLCQAYFLTPDLYWLFNRYLQHFPDYLTDDKAAPLENTQAS